MSDDCSTLVGDELPETFSDFLLDNDISHHQIAVPANKDGVISITADLMLSVLKLVTDQSNYPLLIHCNRGKVCPPYNYRIKHD